jgi:hypothetical protein
VLEKQGRKKIGIKEKEQSRNLVNATKIFDPGMMLTRRQRKG